MNLSVIFVNSWVYFLCRPVSIGDAMFITDNLKSTD